MDKLAIKSMNLYSQVDRIYNDLRALGIADETPLSVEILSQFDQYHYFGTDAVDEAIEAAGIGAASRVLDVGSGLGGPARYLAQRTKCKVTALELQDDLNEVASTLTRRCGLSANIEHVCGDVMTWQPSRGAHDALVSWLALFHVPDQPALFSRCAHALRPGARLYIEDLYSLNEFTAREQEQVQHMVYGQNLPRREQYIANLDAAGFADIEFADMTDGWSRFCLQRLDLYRANRDHQVEVHGEAVVVALDTFYATMSELFLGGNLGGLKVIATKI